LPRIACCARAARGGIILTDTNGDVYEPYLSTSGGRRCIALRRRVAPGKTAPTDFLIGELEDVT